MAWKVAAGGSWFIIKAEERRQAPTPPFPVIRPRLQEQMLVEVVPDIVRQALKDATIRNYTIEGRETGSSNDTGR